MIATTNPALDAGIRYFPAVASCELTSESNLLVEAPYGAPVKVSKAVPSERTDHPVRLYLREIGSSFVA
jgi:hypothetical protein